MKECSPQWQLNKDRESVKIQGEIKWQSGGVDLQSLALAEAVSSPWCPKEGGGHPEEWEGSPELPTTPPRLPAGHEDTGQRAGQGHDCPCRGVRGPHIWQNQLLPEPAALRSHIADLKLNRAAA